MKTGAQGESYRSRNPAETSPGCSPGSGGDAARFVRPWSKHGLAWRQREPEWMDASELDDDLHRQALDGLCRINRISFTANRLWSAIRHECEPAGKSLRILEIGSGGGDVLASMARRAPGHIFHGVDISPVAVERARERAKGIDNVRFFVEDVTREDEAAKESGAVPGPAFDPERAGRTSVKYDVVFCSLFLHHFDEVDAVRILKQCGLAARRLVLVEDLARTRTGYLLAWLGGRILSRSPVVHYDGPVSVAGAFTPAEARILAWAAGLGRIEVTRHWPQRFLLAARPT